MRFRNTLILIIALLLLGGYVYFFEVRQPPAEEPTETELQIWQVETASINRLAVTDNKEDQRTELLKEGETWRMTAPAEEEADDPRVKRVVERIGELRATRKLEEQPADLAPFGLEGPAFTIRVGLAEGGEEVLQVGEQNPQRTAYYVRHEGDPAIYLVASYTMEELKRLVSEPPKKPTPTATATPAPEATPTLEVTPAETPVPTPAT